MLVMGLMVMQLMSMSCDGTSRAGLMARHWLYRASSGMTRARVMEKQVMSMGSDGMVQGWTDGEAAGDQGQ